MSKRKELSKVNIDGKRLLNVDEVKFFTGLGRDAARRFCDQIGATRKFGSRVLFDKELIAAALDKMSGAAAVK